MRREAAAGCRGYCFSSYFLFSRAVRGMEGEVVSRELAPFFYPLLFRNPIGGAVDRVTRVSSAVRERSRMRSSLLYSTGLYSSWVSSRILNSVPCRLVINDDDCLGTFIVDLCSSRCGNYLHSTCCQMSPICRREDGVGTSSTEASGKALPGTSVRSAIRNHGQGQQQELRTNDVSLVDLPRPEMEY